MLCFRYFAFFCYFQNFPFLDSSNILVISNRLPDISLFQVNPVCYSILAGSRSPLHELLLMIYCLIKGTIGYRIIFLMYILSLMVLLRRMKAGGWVKCCLLKFKGQDYISISVLLFKVRSGGSVSVIVLPTSYILIQVSLP